MAARLLINISMCRRSKGWGEHPCNVSVIERGAISLGQLICHGVHRMPNDPVWTVETIGM